MNTSCSQCDSYMTICKDNMVCVSCGHSFPFRSSGVSPDQSISTMSAVQYFKFQKRAVFGRVKETNKERQVVCI